MKDALLATWEGGDNLSTYEELMLIVAVAGLIVAILNHKDKK